MTTIANKLITADQLLKMGDIGRCELIYGELIMMSPAGASHGEIASRIDRLIGNFVEENDLGVVMAAETGYLLQKNPDLFPRAPDVSFVARSRIFGELTPGFFDGAPDLAVEVLSPGDNAREIGEKVNMWLAHGTRSVWVADPRTHSLVIHRTGQGQIRLSIDDEIREEPTLPGLTLPLRLIFKRA